MKYIKILLLVLTFTFVGVAAINPVYAEDTTLFNDTESVGENFCDEPSVRNVLRFAGFFLQLARYIVPFILVVQGTFAFFKAVTSDADSELKKSAYAFGRKLAIGMLVFFVPAILDGIFSLFSLFTSVETEYATCKTCLLKPADCKTTGKIVGDDGKSRNCLVLGVSDCAKYSNCQVNPPAAGSNNGPTCGPKADAQQYAENCSIKSVSECSHYYNCQINSPAPGSNNGPTCGSNGKYK